jgi:aspartyl-tRNA(Asn)/glutamyl-tRNA(Gln) amidotransferase subunit B
MRSKEDANDYRYFPEPDLQPITINQEYIETVKKSLPPLPKELFKTYTTEFGLSEYDSNVLIEEKEIALYFNEMCKYTNNYKGAANFMNGVVKSYLNENAIEIGQFEMSPERLAELVKLVDEGKVSNSVATQKVFGEMLKSDLSAEEIAKTNNWIQESDTDALQDFVQQALEKYPEKVEEYKKGKKGLIGLFMGEVMKLSRGKADPKIANKLVREALEK